MRNHPQRGDSVAMRRAGALRSARGAKAPIEPGFGDNFIGVIYYETKFT